MVTVDGFHRVGLDKVDEVLDTCAGLAVGQVLQWAEESGRVVLRVGCGGALYGCLVDVLGLGTESVPVCGGLGAECTIEDLVSELHVAAAS